MNNLNIIILTYNNLDATKKCFENLYKYTNDFNLVVVDNNSVDGTKEYLSEIFLEKRFLLMMNDENMGVIKGRNLSYSLSQKKYPDAEYTCFLDNDQFVQAGWQESHMELFDQGYDVIGCEAWRMKKTDFYPEKKINDKNEEFSYCGAGCMMIREPIFEELGGFDDDFSPMYFEDPNFCWEAYEAGYKIGWNYNPVVYHQKHDLRLKGDRKKYFTNSWQTFQKKWKNYEMPKFKMK